jgi:hypothetical protein
VHNAKNVAQAIGSCAVSAASMSRQVFVLRWQQDQQIAFLPSIDGISSAASKTAEKVLLQADEE